MVYGWARKYGWVSVFDFIVHCCLCKIPQIGKKFTAFGIKLTFNKRENAAELLQSAYNVLFAEKNVSFFQKSGLKQKFEQFLDIPEIANLPRKMVL